MPNRFNSYRRPTVGSSCKDCTKRYPGCHDKCEAYQTSVREHRERKSHIENAKRVDMEWVKHIKENNK